jgi:hypothetical protein
MHTNKSINESMIYLLSKVYKYIFVYIFILTNLNKNIFWGVYDSKLRL